MKKKFFSTLLACVVSGGIFSVSAETVIDDHFNSIQLERSTVAIEDHPENNPWFFDGSKREIRCTDGVLTIGAAPGAGQVQMVSKLKFKKATLKARIRLDKTGSGIHHYIGFLQRNPWHYRSAWVMFNGSGNGHLYMTNGDKKMPSDMVQKIRTGELKPGQWYDLIIKLDETGSELFINGVSKGKIADAAVAPNQGLNLVFIVNPGNQGSGISLDRVTVSGVKDTQGAAPVAVKKVEIPTPAPVKAVKGSVDPNFAPTISIKKNILTMENGFYRWTFDTRKGLVLKEIFSRFIDRNLVAGSGRFFAIYLNKQVLPNDSFKITSIKKQISGDKAVATVVLENKEKKVSGTLTFTVTKDSPELQVLPVFKNNSSAQVRLGVCCPLLGNLKIGDDAKNDEIFFPMESGLAGKMEVDLRQVYGMTLFMQLLSVWNPVAGGGIYAYTCDKTGYPKIMEIKRRTDPKADMTTYNVVPWSDVDQGMFDNINNTSMGWRHLDFDLAPGAKTDIPHAVIGVNKGIWQAGLESYAAFANTWFKKPYETPTWYKDMYSTLSAHPHSGLWIYSGSPSKGYYNKKANEYSYGKSITHLEKNVMQEIAFWWDLPEEYDLPTEELGKLRIPFINVFNVGDFEYNSRRGGLKALKDEIALIHSKNSRIILYTMPRGAAKGTRAYDIGKKWAQLNAFGRPAISYTGDDMGWNFCDMEPGFADYYSKLLAGKIAETGADGFRLDVLCRVSPCFNKEHAHYDGTLRGSTNVVMLGETLKKFKSEVYKHSPEKIVTVEHGGNDYISQFHDGYFAENISWISESPMWAEFRKLNSYMAVFTRFYFPEVKTWIHGPSRTDEAIRMSLFNACGFACTSYNGIRSFRTLEELSDTFNSKAVKKPYIDTPVGQVFANYFASDNGAKDVWTVFNRSGQTQSNLLVLNGTVENKFRFIEVYNDENVSVQNNADNTISVTCALPHNEVAVIARFIKQLDVADNGSEVIVKVDDHTGKHCEIIYDTDDFKNPRKELLFANGKIVSSVPADARKVIVKLYSGKYLLDEVIIKR